MINEKTARKILDDLFDSGYNEATFKHKDLKDTIIEMAIDSLCNLIIKGMPNEKDTTWDLPDRESDHHKDIGFNESLSSCKESVRKVFNDKT